MGANQFTDNSLTGHDIPSVCGVYLITDLITGATYIGSSKNVRTRMVTHFYKMRLSRVDKSTYITFNATYAQYGSSKFSIDILEICAEDELYAKELHWIAKLKPSENTQHSSTRGVAFSDEERVMRSERARKLWANPEYRAKAIAARKGNSYNKGYKCTPEQIENRKRAARISNMKRNYGTAWEEEYIRRYPEHEGDVNA